MSICYNISCHDCKEKLWVGQREYIYKTNEGLFVLERFLFKHEGHHLSFDNDEKHDEFIDYEDE